MKLVRTNLCNNVFCRAYLETCRAEASTRDADYPWYQSTTNPLWLGGNYPFPLFQVLNFYRKFDVPFFVVVKNDLNDLLSMAQLLGQICACMYHDSRDVLAGKTALFLLLRHKRFNHTITSAQTCNKICNQISGKK